MARYCFDIEVWKDIEGFEDRYEVSSCGSIKSKSFVKTGRNVNGTFSFTTKEKLLKPWLNADGYPTVELNSGSKTRTTTVHRLVAEAFLENENPSFQVNHIDGNKLNNTVQNLEWVTAQDNVLHSYKLNLASNKEERHPRSVLTVADVQRIAKLHKEGCSYQEIADSIGKKYHTVWKVVNKKNWIESYEKALEEITNG